MTLAALSPDSPLDALRRAVAVAGGQQQLAEMLGVTQPAVSKWLSKGKMPGTYAIPAERCTGVSRHALSPEMYPLDSTVTDVPLHGVVR